MLISEMMLDYGQVATRRDAHEPEQFTAALQRQIETMIELQRQQGIVRNDQSIRADALDSLVATRDMEQVLTNVLRDIFGPRYSEIYIPIGTGGVEPWADVVIQKRITREGLLDYVTSADMPWIQVRMQEIPHQIRTLGARFGWSWFEMQRAEFGGVPLRTELALATGEAAEDTKDLILLEGDSQLPKGAGFIPTGFINDPFIPITAPTTGGWGAATAAQIIDDVSGMFVVYRTQTRRTHRGSRLLLPEVQIGRIETLQVPNTSVSVRTWLLDNIAELDDIAPLPLLEGAGAGGTDRAVLYPPDRNVLEGVVPLDFSFILEEALRLRLDVYGVLRMIGLIVRRPFAMLYMDGV